MTLHSILIGCWQYVYLFLILNQPITYHISYFETISLKFTLNGGFYSCDVQSILNASLTFQMDLNWISSIINLKSGNLDQKNVLMQNTLTVIVIFHIGFPKLNPLGFLVANNGANFQRNLSCCQYDCISGFLDMCLSCLHYENKFTKLV